MQLFVRFLVLVPKHIAASKLLADKPVTIVFGRWATADNKYAQRPQLADCRLSAS